ncbi:MULTISPECIES: DUF1997 domain-containing protein [unclassified Leptolyngbya]|uniref:DUF1997 domain-containing protein n=1 Tax=unclassified Leptolyngbya TaxID=2650499 RepID=UPI0016825778|nr:MULTISPECIES: DUF1997 domain-containing protein [unclassified Leptolyngbya]MBD1909281.1 DUF1997 domain-containing protein [Leptolyngbya sp. FACHB-8]MBD2153511.1 DUF1997 domain-containing protein [Leptolyngbya sp. FACHB-16]
MEVHFHSSQSVDLSVPELSIPVQHYLRQPQRLVQALVDPSRVEVLSENCFRLKMRPLNFLMLNIQPVVDLELQVDGNGAIALHSVGCEILGVEYINERFRLTLEGRLRPELVYGKTHLKGLADLHVHVDVPPMLWLTPKPILEATGNGLLKSILMTVKQRLTHQLLQDYRHWVEAQMQEAPAANSSLPAPFSTKGSAI